MSKWQKVRLNESKLSGVWSALTRRMSNIIALIHQKEKWKFHFTWYIALFALLIFNNDDRKDCLNPFRHGYLRLLNGECRLDQIDFPYFLIVIVDLIIAFKLSFMLRLLVSKIVAAARNSRRGRIHESFY